MIQSTTKQLVSVLLASSLISVLTYFVLTPTLSTNQDILKSATSSRQAVSSSVEKSSTNGIPLCQQNLLSARNYKFTEWASDSKEPNLLDSDSSTCRLLQFSKEILTQCFDILNQRRSMSGRQSSGSNSSVLHLVFVGDSRIRQQFFNFLKFIPNYDLETTPNPIPPFFHADIEVQSELLQLRLSFKWRPLLDSDVLSIIKQFLADTRPPDWILMGIEAHHMLPTNNATLPIYRDRVLELAPLLDHLGRLTKVIWLNQYPTIDAYRGEEHHNNFIVSEKIQHYNQVVGPILRLYPNIKFWDSSNKLAEEYIRGCIAFERSTPVAYAGGSMANCEDYIHTGNIALIEATQILLNDFCNSHLYAFGVF